MDNEDYVQYLNKQYLIKSVVEEIDDCSYECIIKIYKMILEDRNENKKN